MAIDAPSVAAPELDAASAAAAAALAAEAAAAGADAPLSGADVSTYLSALRGVDAKAAGGSADALEGVRKEAVAAAGAAPALPADIAAPALPAALAAADAPFAAAAGAEGADGEGDALLAAFRADLAELEAIQIADYDKCGPARARAGPAADLTRGRGGSNPLRPLVSNRHPGSPPPLPPSPAAPWAARRCSPRSRTWRRTRRSSTRRPSTWPRAARRCACAAPRRAAPPSRCRVAARRGSGGACLRALASCGAACNLLAAPSHRRRAPRPPPRPRAPDGVGPV